MKVALIEGIRSKKLIDPLYAAGVECIVVKSPFKKLEVDCVVTDTPGLGILKGWILKKICRTNLIFRIRGNYWQEVRSEGKLCRIRYFTNDNILLRLCDKIITVNHYLKKEVLKRINCDIDVVGVPVDDEVFKIKKRSNNSFNIITVTNFRYIEKIRPLIEYADVIDNFLMSVDGNWLIAGKGKYVNFFINKTKKYKTLKYCGYVKIPEFLCFGQVMVHLSEFEGLSNAILEAMAAGIPIIVNNFEPLVEIEGTIVVNCKEELAEWLHKLYENPKIRLKIGIKNRNYIRKYYNKHVIGNKLKKSLRNIY